MKVWYLTGLFASLPSFWVIMAWLGGKTDNHKLSERARRATFWVSSAVLAPLAVAVSLLMAHVLDAVNTPLFKLNPLNSVIIMLVIFIGLVLMRYSRNYMAGEACYPSFFRWMMLSLTAVVVTLLANHLILFWLGWVAISLSLHRLLMLYPERPRAVLAAHKKFFLARIAELAVLSAFVLLYMQHHTFYVSELVGIFSSDAFQLARYDTAAAICLSIAALIKCAQLPVHGWLIKVVEVPTPVSALLHAGIINLGGYLLILFAPLISQVPAAQWLLLIVAGLSTLLAGLIMMTRVSLKVRLAWSTSSQMGLMLIECGLGLYSLALLHLVAHSVYKAFAFLNSGNAVYEHLQHGLSQFHSPTWADWANAMLVTGVVISAGIWWTQWQGPISPWVLIGLAMSQLIALRPTNQDQLEFYASVAMAVVLVAGYSLFKNLSASWVFANESFAVGALSAMDIWIMVVFILLFSLSLALRFAPQRKWVQRLSRRLFAGLYLDEWFTRITLRLWPVTLPDSPKTTAPLVTIEGR